MSVFPFLSIALLRSHFNSCLAMHAAVNVSGEAAGSEAGSGRVRIRDCMPVSLLFHAALETVSGSGSVVADALAEVLQSMQIRGADASVGLNWRLQVRALAHSVAQ